LFAESHEDKLERSRLISTLSEERVLEKNVKVVSSANKIGEVVERALGRSLMYIKKRIGPRTEP
jgi:hypothetical protein